MIDCLLEALLSIVFETLVRIILWPVWLVVLMILTTPYALIAARFDQTAYWTAVRKRYQMTLMRWGGFPGTV